MSHQSAEPAFTVEDAAAVEAAVASVEARKRRRRTRARLILLSEEEDTKLRELAGTRKVARYLREIALGATPNGKQADADLRYQLAQINAQLGMITSELLAGTPVEVSRVTAAIREVSTRIQPLINSARCVKGCPIGNNLNQLALKVNAGQITHGPDVTVALEAMRLQCRAFHGLEARP